MDSNQEDLVAQFVGITGAKPASAQAGLEAANWNLQEAVQLYFAAQEDPQGDEDDDDEPAASASDPTSAQPSSSTNPPRQRRQHMTLDDLKKMSSVPGGGEDEDDEDKKQQDMFAGGEKSGLAVQNPNRPEGRRSHFQNIMRQAQQNHERPPAQGEEEEEPARPSAFQGRAQTLGGEGTESQVVEDPMQRVRDRMRRQQRERVTRTLHLWADGVSIDDGPLFRFDDPANEEIMAQIHSGRAPMQLLDVQPDQEVDLNLEPHKDENYVQPKKVYKPFSGQGQRLGSPTPGADASSSSTPATSAPAAAAPASSNAEAPKPDVDESAPTLQLQIRLADGTRLPSRFNTTHTIGDVYNFVNRASAESNQRPWALMTTFPSKELDDKSLVLGEMSDFKRGGVVVQKWK